MISICILTKNSERSLAKTLESAAGFPDIVLLDTGSSDATLDIARQFPQVRIFETPFTGFGPLRNKAASLAAHDWILALDSDEVLSPDLAREILSLPLDPGAVYEIPFHNYFNRKRIYGCGWHPESHIRLYCRNTAAFSEHAVHEGVVSEGLSIRPLRHPILHTPYLSIADFLRKMQLYTDLFANEYRGKRRSSLIKALLHGSSAFGKSYFLKKGILDGAEGAIISLYNASTAFYKYLKLAEINRC